MAFLEAICRTIDRINEAIGRLMGWFTVAAVLIVFMVVVLRYAFGIGWIWMQELYVWLHATAFMLGAGYTLLHDGHVRIDLIYRNASKKYKSIVDIAGCIVFAAPLLYVLSDRSLPMVLRSWNVRERSAEAGGLPGVYLLKSVIVLFCVLLGLQVLSMLLRNLSRLLAGSNRPEGEQQ